MANRKFSQFTAGGASQVPTDVLVGLDLSQASALQNTKWTLNNLFAKPTLNITDGAMRFGAPGSAPAVSSAGEGSIYFDGTQFQVSSNAGAYTPLSDVSGSFTSGQVAYANGTKSLTSSSGFTFAANALTLGTAGTPGELRLVGTSGNYWNLASSAPAGNRTFYFPDSTTPTTGNFLFVGTFGATVVTDWSTGLTWSNTSKQITVTSSTNAQIGLGVQNTNAGTAAECVVGFTANGGAISLLSLTGTGFSTSGLYKANQLYWRGTTGITEMLFALDDASTAFKFGVNNVVAASINATSTEGLVLGIASSLTGRVKLYNSAGATYTQISAGNAASSLNYILPVTAPTVGQVLTAAAPSGGNVVLSWGAGGGGDAPADATYLTLSLNGTLTNERVFTLADTTLLEVDNGAGSTYTLGVDQANTFAWTAAHTHTVAIGAGSATSTSPSPFITASPTTAPGAGNYKASPSIILNGQANSGASAFNSRYRLYTLVNDNAGNATLDFQFNNANVDATFRSVLQLTQGGATGLAVTGAAAGSGITLVPISTGTNESLNIIPKGGGGVALTHSASVNTTTPLLSVSPLLNAQSSATYYGVRVNATIRPAASNTSSVVLNQATGTIDVSNPPALAIGFQAAVNHNAAGTLSQIRGFASSPAVYGATSAASGVFHFLANDVFTNSLGVVASQYGFYVPNPFGNATANWAFYNASSAQSYLGGNLGINKTSIAAQLDLLTSAQDKWPLRASQTNSPSSEIAVFTDVTGRKRYSVGVPDSNSQTVGLIGGQGESVSTGTVSENVTLNTGGATTDTTIDLPANSIITACTARITATVSGGGVTSLSLGDSSNPTRFSSAGLGLTISDTLSLLSNSPQLGATKLRITANGGTPTNGAVLVTISYVQISAALGSLDNTSTGQPFVNSRLVFDGDSNTLGVGTIGGQSYPAQVVAILGGGNPNNNFGVNGKTIVTMIANAPSQIDPLYNAAHGRDTVICEGGSNDIAFATGQATTTYNNIVIYCNARRAVGWRTYVMTILPRSDVGIQPNFEVDRQAINADIRANWNTFADGLIDIAANTSIGDTGDETNTQYYASDRVHINSAGSAIVAGLAVTAIAPVGSATTALSRVLLQGTNAYLTGPSGAIAASNNFGVGQESFGASAAKVLAIGTGTAPTTYPADAIQLCSQDYAAGDARLRVYSENGALPVIIGGNAVLAGRQVVAKTANYVVQIGESNTVFTNRGAAGSVTFTSSGTGVVESYTFEFIRVANQPLVIQLNPGEIIQIGASVTSAGGSVTLDAVGSRLRIVQVGTSLWMGDLTGAATFA